MKDQKNKNKILLLRNPVKEIESDYSQIYELSKIDTISNITSKEKASLLSIIKNIILCTNQYVESENIYKITEYIFYSQKIFLAYFIFTFVYKKFIYTKEELNLLPNKSIIYKFLYFNIITVFELIFILIFNFFKKKHIKIVMCNFAMNEMAKIQDQFIFLMIFDKFDLIIQRAISEKKKIFRKINQLFEKFENMCYFFKYVIIYPNINFYKWGLNNLTETEKDIIYDLNFKDLLMHYNKVDYYFSFIICVIYIVSFEYLLEHKIEQFLINRSIIFFIQNWYNYLRNDDLLRSLLKKEKLINKKYYLNGGYFIFIDSNIIEIFKLNDNYLKTVNNRNAEENITKLRNHIINLHEKVYTKV